MTTSLDIYSRHFGFSERPFSLVPDPDFLFWSGAHRRAATVLEYGVLTHAPITVVTGEVGSGKTTLLRHLLRVVGDDLTVGLVSNAFGDRGDLMKWILHAFGESAETDAGYVDLFRRFQDFVIEEYARGKRVVLIFDEAQNLSRDALEEIRMLTNINADNDVLLQLVLVGQPALRDTIKRPDLAQFAQRVAAHCFLPAMSATTSGDYIRHRLSLVGGQADLFSEDAIHAIHSATGGIPRLINQICDFALLYAFEECSQVIESQVIAQVLSDGVYFGGSAAQLRVVQGGAHNVTAYSQPLLQEVE